MLHPACVTSSFQLFPAFWQVSGCRFHCLKPYLMASNQLFCGRPRLLSPSTSKSKICLVYSSLLHFTFLNQGSLLHLNTESKLFSLDWLKREFVLTRCSFLMLHIHKSIALSLCSKHSICSCLRAQHSDE